MIESHVASTRTTARPTDGGRPVAMRANEPQLDQRPIDIVRKADERAVRDAHPLDSATQVEGARAACVLEHPLAAFRRLEDRVLARHAGVVDPHVGIFATPDHERPGLLERELPSSRDDLQLRTVRGQVSSLMLGQALQVGQRLVGFAL